MRKMILAAVAISACMAGTAFAHGGDEAETAVGEILHQEQPAPGQTPSDNKNGENAGDKPAPFEYKIGVNGFLRGEGGGNLNLEEVSPTPDHSQGRFLYRVRPFVDWHPVDYLDMHLEGQGYGYSGTNQESNRFSLYQGFVEARLPGSDRLSLKGGRQEFVYGSAFILGADSFYNGLTFDAGRLRLQPFSSLTVDLLGGRYATTFSDDVKGNLTGAYATYAVSEGNAVDAYMFRDAGSDEHHSGEHLDIWGLRGTAKLGPLSIEFEPVFESGRTFNPVSGGNDNINAYGGHVDLCGETTISGRRTTLFLSYAMGSGDGNAANGKGNGREFRNPNNDTSLVGDMGVIGDLSGIDVNDHHASGLHIYTLGGRIDITKELNFSATGHYFLADSVETGFSRAIGLETDFTLTYAVNENISAILGYDRLFTGPFFRNASGSGDDIHYGYAMLQFNLEKSRPRAPKI